MFTSLFLLFVSSITGLNSGKYSNEQQVIDAGENSASYKVRYLQKNDIRIDGNTDDKSWQRCDVIKNLVAPWDNGATGKAQFRACYDESFFYFSFDVKDSIGLYLNQKDEESVAKGDRVEIFFSPDPAMSNYYCFEIAPNANVLDYQASYHRKFDANWNMQGADISAEADKNGYVVEGRLPVSFLKKLMNQNGSMKGTSIQAGIFRARKKMFQIPKRLSGTHG